MLMQGSPDTLTVTLRIDTQPFEPPFALTEPGQVSQPYDPIGWIDGDIKFARLVGKPFIKDSRQIIATIPSSGTDVLYRGAICFPRLLNPDCKSHRAADWLAVNGSRSVSHGCRPDYHRRHRDSHRHRRHHHRDLRHRV